MTKATGDGAGVRKPLQRIRYLIEGVFVALLPMTLSFVIPGSWHPRGAIAGNLFHIGQAWTWVAIAWLVLRLRGEGVTDIGLTWPKSWGRSLALGVGFGLTIFACSLVRDALGYKPNLSFWRQLYGDLPLTISFIAVSFFGAGFSEEFMLRGVTLNSFAKGLGESRWAWIVAIAGQALLFGILHRYMGPAGVVWSTSMGVLLGVLYLVSGRNLLALMIGHGLHDAIKMVMFYSIPSAAG